MTVATPQKFPQDETHIRQRLNASASPELFRRKGKTDRAGFTTYAFAFLLVPLANLDSLTQNVLSRSVVTAVFLLLLAKNLILLPALSVKYWRNTQRGIGDLISGKNLIFNAFLALLVLALVAEVRGIYHGFRPFFSFIGLSVWAAAIFLFTYTEYRNLTRDSEREKYAASLCIGIGLYVAINLVGYLLGIKSNVTEVSPGPNRTLSYIGINFERVLFPFGAGLNNFSIVAGLGLVGAVSSFLRIDSLWWRSLLLLTGMVCLVALILVDSRATYLVLIALAVLLQYYRKGVVGSRTTVLIVVCLAVLPLIAVKAFSLLNQVSFLDFLVREGRFARTLGVASGRDFIWGSVLQVMSDPHPIHVIGYGVLGQITSGATKEYSWIFADSLGQATNSVHNMFLQTWVDFGYLGVSVWALFQFRMIQAFLPPKNNRPMDWRCNVTPLALILFFFLSGVTEVAGSNYINSYTIMVMLTAIAAVDLQRRKSLADQS